MIKKVKVKYLKIGVYVHDFNCDWNGCSLYIEPGHIKSDSTVEILKKWGIEEVSIDTDKGLDIDLSSASGKVNIDNVFECVKKLKRPNVKINEEIIVANQISEEAISYIKESCELVSKGSDIEIANSYKIAKKMKDSIKRNRDALALLSRIRKKDQYTLYHSVSVSALVLNMCQYYDVPERESLDMAVGALFHDIGKSSISEKILNKPGKLTSNEFAIMKKHAEYSMDILSKTKGLPLECYDIALHHHERYDGSGYPHGLKGDDIGFAAQLTSICDVFDAVTSERCYKSGMDTVMGLRLVYEGCESHFRKKLAHDFIQCIGVFPVGTCVTLSDGRNGVVVGSTDDIMKPIVRIINAGKDEICDDTIDLTVSSVRIVNYSDSRAIGISADQLLQKFIIE